jgi:hypothetical protein
VIASHPASAVRYYRMFGMTLASSIALEGIPETEPTQAPSLAILRARVRHPELDPELVEHFLSEGGEQILHWKAVGTFRIRTPDRIEVDVAPGVPDRLVALPLLGSVLACLLVRRGLVVMHASAVTWDGRAVILLGHKGAGKSTTAATLTGNGYGLLSDDVVAIETTPSGHRVLPAFGLIKLWGESARHFDPQGARRLWRIHETLDKAHYQLADGLSATPAPLARLYVLQRDAEARVTGLPPDEALPAALEHAYMARYGLKGFGPAFGHHFQTLGALAGAGAIRRLNVPEGIDRLDTLPQVIEKDLTTQGSDSAPRCTT